MLKDLKIGKLKRSSAPNSGKRKEKRKKKTQPHDEKFVNIFAVLSTCVPSAINDEPQDFGKTVTKTLRKYDVLARFSMKNSIMDIFFYVNRNHHYQ